LKYRKQRKYLHAKRKSKGKESYSTGAFGLDSKPETTVNQGKKIKSRNNFQVLPSTSREEHMEITFAEPVFEVVAPLKEQCIDEEN